jgi:PIN domain nuclease of toxin-antitoxin system
LVCTKLPAIHRDPFDRLLVAQAMLLDLVLVTADPLVAEYPTTTVLV